MAELWMMIGIPGSGKSTYAKNLLTSNDAYISRDEIRFRLMDDDMDYFKNEKLVMRQFKKEINQALESTKDRVFVDATHVNEESRRRILGGLSVKIDRKVAIYINTPLEVALKRNSEREGFYFVPESAIENLNNKLTLPTEAEGFDVLTTVLPSGETSDQFLQSRIWVTSDLHLGHNKEFVWRDRGFESVEEMNAAIVERWNAVVSDIDTVYILGDVIMGKKSETLPLIEKLKGTIVIVAGNHDVDKIDAYENLSNVKKVVWGEFIKYKKVQFYMSHFPSISMLAYEDRKYPIWALHGHTHQTHEFYCGNPHTYHVGMDTHSCTPILLSDVYQRILEEKEKQNG